MKVDIKDFIGVFDDAVPLDFCDDVVKHFDYVKASTLTSSRQELEGVERLKKKDDTYFFQDEMDDSIQLMNSRILGEVNRAVVDCVNLYFNEYDILHAHNYGIYSYRLQKTPVGGGYHVWHHERGDIEHSNRFLAFILYLNDVDEGGETEFHYYPRRVAAKKGRLLMFPAEFTHTHRGNSPLSNDKYVIATWAAIIK